MLPHPIISFEIQKYYQNEPKFNGVYGTYVINLDEFRSIGAHWIGLYVNNNSVTCFESFGVKKRAPKGVKKIIRKKKYYNKYS